MPSEQRVAAPASSFVCPQCKGALAGLFCPACNHQYATEGGFPLLLPRDPALAISRELVAVYEEIYTEHAGVWVNQGRTAAFIEYFSRKLNAYQPRTLLEIGCGEGVLLRELQANRKWATDLAISALTKAAAATAVEACVALGEQLPFADGFFDVVTSVGVMEHFVDDARASREICRVTRVGGHYVVLIHIHLSVWQSIQQKISEYIFPVPRPLGLLRWLTGKFYKPVHQPIQNAYTIASVQACLEQAGFRVTAIIHRGVNADVPLIGPHVIIYVCEKPEQR